MGLGGPQPHEISQDQEGEDLPFETWVLRHKHFKGLTPPHGWVQTVPDGI